MSAASAMTTALSPDKSRLGCRTERYIVVAGHRRFNETFVAYSTVSASVLRAAGVPTLLLSIESRPGYR